MFWLLLSLRAIVFALLLTLYLQSEKGKPEPMKILKRLFFLMSTLLLWSEFANGQEDAPTLYDELNPDFKLEQIHLSEKNVNIIGQAPDGRLLVRCTRDPDPKTIWRKDPDYFWVSLSDDGDPRVENMMEADQYLFEIAKYNENTLVWTKEFKGAREYRQKKPGAKTSSVFQVDSLEHTLLHPFIFHPRTSNYPILLFSAVPSRRKDYDIFYSEFKGNGVWSRPRPLVAKGINKPGSNETRPFVSEDGTLFFSSDRIEGTGKKRKDGKCDLWAAVPTHKPLWENASVNPLPPPFNTWGEERIIAPLGPGFRTGFLVSDSADEPLKLYFFKSTLKDTMAPPPRYYALVIGAKDYKNGWDPLICPIDECRQLAQVLKSDYGFEVTTLENPDSTQFMEALGQYQGHAENEYLLVAFIGHGIRYLSDDKQNYFSQFVCIDAPKCQGRASDNTTCEKSTPHSINPDGFAKALSLQSKHILVVADACRSGYFIPSETQPSCEQKSRWVISSTEGDEVGDCADFFSGLMKTLTDPVLGKNLDSERLFIAIKKFMIDDPQASNEPTYKSFKGCNKNLHFPFPPKRN